jgi:hypothetical protein
MDAIVAEFYDNHSYRLYDMWSSKSGMPSNDTDLKGTYDFTNVQYSYVNGTHTLSFVRKLNTGDKYDNVIEKVF